MIFSVVGCSFVYPCSKWQLFVIPWAAAHQASLSSPTPGVYSNSCPKSIELVMPSDHLILCCHLLLLPSIFPSIRVFSNESALRIRWPKSWSFSFNISPSSEHSGLISFKMDWTALDGHLYKDSEARLARGRGPVLLPIPAQEEIARETSTTLSQRIGPPIS